MICNENKLEVKQGIEPFTKDEVYKKIFKIKWCVGGWVGSAETREKKQMCWNLRKKMLRILVLRKFTSCLKI